MSHRSSSDDVTVCLAVSIVAFARWTSVTGLKYPHKGVDCVTGSTLGPLFVRRAYGLISLQIGLSL